MTNTVYFRNSADRRSRLMGLVMYSVAPSAYPMLLLSTMVSMITGMSASSGSAFSALSIASCDRFRIRP